MEGPEENCLPRPQFDEEKHQPQPHQQLLQELGLGLQPSIPSSPPAPKHDPNLDPPLSSSDCLDQQIVHKELQNQQKIKEDLQNHQTMSEELQHQQTISDELQNQLTINEELQNLVLQGKDRAHTDHEEDVKGRDTDLEVDVKGEENKGNEEDADQEDVVKDEDNNENEDDKEEDEINNDDDNEKEDEDEDEELDDDKLEAVKDEENMEDNDKSENEEDAEGSENIEEDPNAMPVLKNGKYRRYHYPVRPDAEDCSYYMRTGSCKFGLNCKFNHPPKRRNQAAKEKVKENEMEMEMEENPERPGQTECKYYLRSGGCKFGKACRYNHSRGKTPVVPTLDYNFLGLPIRPGERECPYYMRNGSCKYGSNCRFNHPDPTAVGGGDPPGYGNGGSVSLQGASQSTMSAWSLPRKLNENAPFVPMMLSPTQGVPSPNPDWDGYQAPVYPTPERSLPTPPAFAMNNPATETNFFAHHQQQMVVEEFPERPGQPECSYFMKTGDCKFRSGCKFHHPKNRISKAPTCTLSDKGLPLRPDQNICTHYSRYGICKFGPACKFDHPEDYTARSASSGPDNFSYANLAIADGARMAGSGSGSEHLTQWPV